QERFKTILAHLIAGANLLYSWMEHSEWKQFFTEFVLGAEPFSCKVLTDCIILGALNVMESKVRSKIQGQVVSVHTDSWSRGNHHHFQAFKTIALQQICALFSFIIRLILLIVIFCPAD
ncbi:uncharacterized protein PHACADRAFT_108520, partial [Phanerochaete carnosa HHB-10118-sp]